MKEMQENQSFWELLKNLSPWQIFIIALIVVVLYFAQKTGLIDKIFKSKQDEAKRKLQKEFDKLNNDFKETSRRKALKNIESGAHHAVEELEHCIGANYYIIHDSGEDLRNVDKWYCVVRRSTSFAIGTDYGDPVLFSKGFKWLNEQGRDKLYFYVPDVEKEPNLVGLDLDYLKTMGIKSCAVAIVKNKKTSYEMVSLNFDRINPLEKNPDLRKVIFDFKRTVLNNI